MKYFSRKNSTIKGFTLVETLVAILALSLSLGALTTITSRSVSSARNAEQRIQAELLALEAVEAMQYQIMNYIIGTPSAPIDTIPLTTSCAAGCSVKYLAGSTEPTFEVCQNSANQCASVVNVVSSNLPTGYSNGPMVGNATPFRRLLYTKPSKAADGGVTVRAVVWYSKPGDLIPKMSVLSKELRPWYSLQVAPPAGGPTGPTGPTGGTPINPPSAS